MGTVQLGVNVDHIATLRQVRYATTPDSKNAEPDPVVAASLCERAGASGITAHLRSDRRHVQERDLKRLRANIMIARKIPFNIFIFKMFWNVYLCLVQHRWSPFRRGLSRQFNDTSLGRSGGMVRGSRRPRLQPI